MEKLLYKDFELCIHKTNSTVSDGDVYARLFEYQETNLLPAEIEELKKDRDFLKYEAKKWYNMLKMHTPNKEQEIPPSRIKKDMRQIAEHYGLTSQYRQTIEELSELILAISKVCRFEEYDEVYTLKNVMEEIADVEIMTYQLKYLIGCFDTVKEIKREKVDRQLGKTANVN